MRSSDVIGNIGEMSRQNDVNGHPPRRGLLVSCHGSATKKRLQTVYGISETGLEQDECSKDIG
jgi:hypothetical protein